jgi:hypothetical protein
MVDPFDPDRLRIRARPSGPLAAAPPPRPQPGGKFLKGPIPMDWLARAAALPGKALAVGLAVWFEAGCVGRAEVTLSLSRIGRLGLTKNTARRGLVALERAELVGVDRRPGRAPRVTLVNPG